MNDLELSNRKAAGENGELSRQLEEVNQNVSLLHKLRHQLNNQLEDVKKTYEEESKECDCFWNTLKRRGLWVATKVDSRRFGK